MRKAGFLKILLLISFIGIISCTKDTNDSIPQFNTVNDITIEAQIMSLVNMHRESIGLSKLEFNDVAYTHANEHTDYMIAIEKLNHDNFSSRAFKISSEANAKEIGENVARRYTTAQTVFNGWITSLEHKTNIESDFTHTAISAKKDANGDFYFTQIFFK